ncbi:MAG: TetR/AcrR family transcriptional regulator [Peptococcaceae bacterium]|nr:TetR/AcrR family transcriptional regulator [Peptococcaceae bacterium]
MPKQTFFNLPKQKRDLITRLALEEFASHDYHSASLSKIVERAGIAKGSMYQYFGGKKDLYLYLFNLVGQAKLSYITSKVPDPESLDLFSYLKELMMASAGFEIHHPLEYRMGMRVVYGDSPFKEEERQQMKNAVVDFYKGLLIRGIERGELDPDLDVDAAAFLLSAVSLELGSFIMNRLDLDSEDLQSSKIDWEALEPILDTVIALIKNGIARR